MSKQCTDHLGNTFKSIEEMCKYYHIKQITFYSRLKKDYSLEEALTIPVNEDKKPKQCQDHLGNTFGSFRKMCKYYNVNERTIKKRLERGSSLKEALTTPTVKISPKQCTDHLGNTFESFRKMCKYYNIDHRTVNYRLKNGDSLKEALTTSVTKISSKQCQDHLGNTFKSFSDMCKHYNIDYRTAYNHLKGGWTIEEILMKKNPEQKRKRKRELMESKAEITKYCKEHGLDPTYEITEAIKDRLNQLRQKELSNA